MYGAAPCKCQRELPTLGFNRTSSTSSEELYIMSLDRNSSGEVSSVLTVDDGFLSHSVTVKLHKNRVHCVVGVIDVDNRFTDSIRQTVRYVMFTVTMTRAPAATETTSLRPPVSDGLAEMATSTIPVWTSFFWSMARMSNALVWIVFKCSVLCSSTSLLVLNTCSSSAGYDESDFDTTLVLRNAMSSAVQVAVRTLESSCAKTPSCFCRMLSVSSIMAKFSSHREPWSLP